MKALLQFFHRWQTVRANMRKVLSMNGRNLHYVYPHNHRRHFPLADNKLTTKELLAEFDIPLAQTYLVYNYFYELRNLRNDLEQYDDFVIKPASGSGGGGIVVISGKRGENWISVNGTEYSLQELRGHISDIIFGIYSFGLHDQAIIESRVVQHPEVSKLSPYGLADIRIILCRNEPVLAMIRLATRDSKGTANLHQGAIGVGIDIKTGKTCHATSKRESINQHPDSGVDLLGHSIPYWSEILDTGRKIAGVVPLKYIGVDIAVSESGPRLLEINARPGIEIQNANQIGMRGILEGIA